LSAGETGAVVVLMSSQPLLLEYILCAVVVMPFSPTLTPQTFLLTAHVM